MLNNFGENGKNVEVYVLKIINNQLDIGSLEEKQDLKDLLDPELSGYCTMLFLNNGLFKNVPDMTWKSKI